MLKYSLFLMYALSTIVWANEPKIVQALYLSPQIKWGKMENGNGFMDIQYIQFQYDLTSKYTLSGGLNTGLTAPRTSPLKYNHSINRLFLKFTYRPYDALGVFFEGSFTDNIAGATNPTSYFVYENYQAVGVSWDIKRFVFE